MPLSPNGSPVVGSDNYKEYFTGFVWTAQETGVYRLRVTPFESVNTGAFGTTRALNNRRLNGVSKLPPNSQKARIQKWLGDLGVLCG